VQTLVKVLGWSTDKISIDFHVKSLVKKSGFGLLFTAYVQQKTAKRLLIKKILKSKLKKLQITTKRLLRCTYYLKITYDDLCLTL
jgi:hypothetical protein